MSDGIVGDTNESQLATLGAKQAVGVGRRILDLTLGVQRTFIDEMSLASDETFQRLHAEMDIGAEFVARVASAHSVHEIMAACGDCSQHRADAFRRDSQLLFKRSQRLCEQTSRLLSRSQQQ